MIIYRTLPLLNDYFEWEERTITFPKEGAFQIKLQRHTWNYIEFRAARYQRTLVDTLYGMIGHLLHHEPSGQYQRLKAITFRQKRDYEQFMTKAFNLANDNGAWREAWHDHHWVEIGTYDPDLFADGILMGQRARKCLLIALERVYPPALLDTLCPDRLSAIQDDLEAFAAARPRAKPQTLDQYHARIAKMHEVLESKTAQLEASNGEWTKDHSEQLKALMIARHNGERGEEDSMKAEREADEKAQRLKAALTAAFFSEPSAPQSTQH